jgi:hypothetical protein
VASTQYGTITEADLTAAAFDVTLACAAGYASAGTPTAVACTSAGDYTVVDPCTEIAASNAVCCAENVCTSYTASFPGGTPANFLAVTGDAPLASTTASGVGSAACKTDASAGEFVQDPRLTCPEQLGWTPDGWTRTKPEVARPMELTGCATRDTCDTATCPAGQKLIDSPAATTCDGAKCIVTPVGASCKVKGAPPSGYGTTCEISGNGCKSTKYSGQPGLPASANNPDCVYSPYVSADGCCEDNTCTAMTTIPTGYTGSTTAVTAAAVGIGCAADYAGDAAITCPKDGEAFTAPTGCRLRAKCDTATCPTGQKPIASPADTNCAGTTCGAAGIPPSLPPSLVNSVTEC